uniref:Uncharacterized protein n=1 Tax=Caenorhabditis japonica TaxID=281687 RepID=A0A8R1IVQ6_CAEJA
MDEYFRQLELPIENSPTLNKSAMPNVHRKQDKDRIHIKTRELRGVKEEMSENR